MSPERIDTPRMTDPFATLERALVDEYLVSHGQDPAATRMRTGEGAKALLRAAMQHAALRLTEVECRAHYVHEMHRAGAQTP
jgi:hypothetical protein